MVSDTVALRSDMVETWNEDVERVEVSVDVLGWGDMMTLKHSISGAKSTKISL